MQQENGIREALRWGGKQESWFGHDGTRQLQVENSSRDSGGDFDHVELHSPRHTRASI